ncbi:MAG: divalent-cation tolerance protein CutA [Solirubrobacteraceae bacterium]
MPAVSPQSTETVVCLVTAPQADAPSIASTVVGRQLAACVNIVPLVHSVYRWEGKVEQDEEALLIVKTTRTRVSQIDDLLRTIHPYDTFELVALDVTTGSRSYLDWIVASMGDSTPTDRV